MKKINKNILIIGSFLSAGVMSSSLALAADSTFKLTCSPPSQSACIDCQRVDALRQKAMDRMINNASMLYEKGIRTPDTTDFITKCLSGLRSGMFGLNILIPDFSQVLATLCRMAVSQVNSMASGVDLDFTLDPMGELGVDASGVGVGSNSYGGTMSSDAAFNKGMDSYNNRFNAGGGAPPSVGLPVQQSAPAPVSNSNYMNTTVNSAMKYLTGP